MAADAKIKSAPLRQKNKRVGKLIEIKGFLGIKKPAAWATGSHA